MNDSVLMSDVAALVVSYFRREIGRLMQQADHWAKNDKPLAVHHRVTKADAYYQVVSLFERHGKFDQNVFDIMRAEIARQDIYPPGSYPPSRDLHRYRDPCFVCEMVTGEQHATGEVYVPGQWRCPKCKFVLNQFNLNANDGSVTTRDEVGDKCPNCDKPLWRVTWKEDAMEMAERLATEFQARREADGQWLIFSRYHSAWWRANSAGYTTDVRGAGLYSREEALDIAATCRDGWTDPSSLPIEIAVPLSSIPAAIRKTMEAAA